MKARAAGLVNEASPDAGGSRQTSRHSSMIGNRHLAVPLGGVKMSEDASARDRDERTCARGIYRASGRGLHGTVDVIASCAVESARCISSGVALTSRRTYTRDQVANSRTTSRGGKQRSSGD
eukprot:6200813-Pleurochrysis_carterae.AAC.1